MKKLLVLALTALMIFGAVAVSAAEYDDSFAITLPETVEEGKEFTVVVTRENAACAFSAFSFDVLFDKDKVEFVSFKNNNPALSLNQSTPEEGKVRVAFMDMTGANVTAGTNVATVTFKAKEVTAEPGASNATEIRLDSVKMTRNTEGSTIPTTLNVPVGEVKTLTLTTPKADFVGLVFENKTFDYDATAKSISVENAPAGATVTYENNGQINAGTYTVNATVAMTGYNDANLTATITITPAPLTVVATGTALAFASPAFATDDVTLNTTNVVINKVGEKWIASGYVVEGAQKDNYALTNETVEVTVQPTDVVKVTVVADLDGTTAAVDHEFYKNQAVSLTAPTEKGYKFLGWYIGGVEQTKNETYNFVSTADFTIVAKYEKSMNMALILAGAAAANKKIVVEFETDGAGRIAAQTIEKGGRVTEPVAPIKTGYVFAGWYSDVNLTRKFDFNTAVNSALTLYAKWSSNVSLVMTIGSKDAVVSGKVVTNDVAPVIINDRTMLPARFVAENLGATVTWDAAARKATIKNEAVTIELVIDSDIAYVNGVAVKIDSPAVIINNRTYTPVRFIAEKLGATVTWNGATSQATITK